MWLYATGALAQTLIAFDGQVDEHLLWPPDENAAKSRKWVFGLAAGRLRSRVEPGKKISTSFIIMSPS